MPKLVEILRGESSDPYLLPPGSEIRRETIFVTMRDGVRLATDVYLPARLPAPTLALRTPYGRAMDPEGLTEFARHGFVVAAQDCRGTGESEPETWHMFIYEGEDGFDFVEWVTRQSWFNGFVGAIGGSYCAATQWAMSMHPQMSAIAPEVGGLCISQLTARYYMFVNAFSRTSRKGRLDSQVSYAEIERSMRRETLEGGYFNEPLEVPFREALIGRYSILGELLPDAARRWLWEHFCAAGAAERAEIIRLALGIDIITYDAVWALTSFFGHRDLPGWVVLPSSTGTALAQSLHAPALVLTGWYDWGLFETLASWELLMQSASVRVKARSHLVITPNAHNVPGYHEDERLPAALKRNHRQGMLDLRRTWYAAWRDRRIEAWPRVMYYLMGADEWFCADVWPLPEVRLQPLYLGSFGTLLSVAPGKVSMPDSYEFDPTDPTPTIGGSIVSFVWPPGSVDVSEAQQRPDVLTYTTPVLKQSIDVVGSLRLVLYASSSAMDTDLCARLSDVFPDGRAIQLQAGILRARYRNRDGKPLFLEPGVVYRFEIDLWATANRFKAGHRVRLDISSADFPRFDRNSNRDGSPGPPTIALQSIYHDEERPSHLILPLARGELN